MGLSPDPHASQVIRNLFGEVKVISEPLPCLDLRNFETGTAVCERREEEEAPENSGKNDSGSNPATKEIRAGNTLTNWA